ncbi:ATP-binding cassette domain-containing protein [Neoactinobaculum massilliense]|uniref:ATP-binding cassette domain-containing protein n=1 Tax=Neoactinobaculum massilliense TaxID=2364794 RepID=UPI000F5316C3|nr:ABC transporter ATP-binding protein [Neoactinobaculum massilliense]
MSIISLRGVEKSFHGRPVFTDVNLDVEEGTAVALQGENGSGKSVLLKIMCGFVAPDAGTVTIDPRYLSKGRTFSEGFGVLIDRPGYIPLLSGLDNLMSLARIRNKIDERKVRATLELVGLDPDLPQKTRYYSLGMKQRLGIAQAIMEDQPILLLDEPFNALDVDTVAEFRSLFRRLVDSGRTLVLTSHNQDDINAVADVAYRFRREHLELVPALGEEEK